MSHEVVYLKDVLQERTIRRIENIEALWERAESFDREAGEWDGLATYEEARGSDEARPCRRKAKAARKKARILRREVRSLESKVRKDLQARKRLRAIHEVDLKPQREL